MALTEKAYLKIEKSADNIPCMFNPSELTLSQSNDWDSKPAPGKGAPQISFKGVKSGTMSLSLVFDTTSTGETVTIHTNKVMALMDIDESLPGTDKTTRNARPPTVTFHWGNFHSFEAVATGLKLTFTYFSSTGTPLRAKIDLDLMQFKDPDQHPKQNPTSGTPEPHRVHRVKPGETLDRISAQYYGDSTKWRQIATANTISDPLAIRVGSLLSIPRNH
ncbi:LysM domain-containing protein [Nakamurella antarctica]|uniref:LysM domain-containing protein n=1 Tax=Nakamurella antarctica TaxID=1902245 RepID=A0A3G8ZMI4_9ACTN|nr:LysM peptidoglycan-binding domain-containing protein [Nakamurella antarctica]AZI58007.1 LysM domain-containing protein [Nakamurella antarctica]